MTSTPSASPRALHRQILLRLLAGWFVISLVVGSAVLYLELKKIDERVLELALADSARLAVWDPARLTRHDPDYVRSLQQASEEMVTKNFVVIEVYDSAKQLLVLAVRPDAWDIEARLSQYPDRFPRDGRVRYSVFYIGKRMLLQVFVPLATADGSIFGYFEGVYAVDPDALHHIRQDMTRVLVLVMVVIFVTSALLYPIILGLNRGLIRLTRDLLKSNVELMQVLGSAIAQRDSGTNTHNYRVTLYAIRLAEALGLERRRIHDLIAGAFLHDVGKIGISDAILLKEGGLSDAEAQKMHEHVRLGLQIIDKAQWLQAARDVVEFHHEKWDGSGYPHGLKGEAIPINARVFAIVDVFDALTSARSYKSALSFDQAMETLSRGAGSHFDPALLEAFRRIALPLYAEIHGAPETRLRQTLARYLDKYFFQ
ncbi:MAG: HD-GYP domain-containing protein [Pseudomonadota bacterium]